MESSSCDNNDEESNNESEDIQLKNKHMCYIIKSIESPYVYIGYTVDFNRRFRQHNREIKGGAKHTARYYPFKPICVITGFPDDDDGYMARSFEWHLQHTLTKSKRGRRRRVSPRLKAILANLERVINSKGGSKTKDTLADWPDLYLHWYIDHKIKHKRVNNVNVN